MRDLCAECGYDYDALSRAEIAPALRRDALALRARIEGADDAALRRRAAPTVWSPLEYACHVRDVLDVQRGRVLLALVEAEPEFVPMGRDERAIEQRYNEQDATTVGVQLDQAADALATTLEGLDDAGWDRTGLYSYPAPQLRSVEWIGRHTVHELRHHTRDVEGLLG